MMWIIFSNYIYVKFQNESYKMVETPLKLGVFDIRSEIKKMGIKLIEMEDTVEKLKTVQAIGYDIGGYGNIGNSWGAFMFNEYSDRLYDLIKKFKIFNKSQQVSLE